VLKAGDRVKERKGREGRRPRERKARVVDEKKTWAAGGTWKCSLVELRDIEDRLARRGGSNTGMLCAGSVTCMFFSSEEAREGYCTKATRQGNGVVLKRREEIAFTSLSRCPYEE